MPHLIDKDALRAEIEALQDATMDENRNFKSSYDEGKFDALTVIDNLLDTLEVKDENAIKRDWYNKGYIKGRKEASIPARELGLPSALDASLR